MPTNKLLLRLQRIVAGRRLRWAHDPRLWVELFVTANLAILAADIYIAHSVNHFQRAAEYGKAFANGTGSSCIWARRP